MAIEIIELFEAAHEDAVPKRIGVGTLLSHTVEKIEGLVSSCIARDLIWLILLKREVDIVPR